MTLRFSDLKTDDNENIDRTFFNRRYRLIAETITDLATKMESYSTTEDRLISLGLQRINDVLGPALTAISSAVEIGFLVAESTTTVSMQTGVDVLFEIPASAGRDIYAPTPHLLVMDADDENNWAIVKRLSWSKQTGELGVRPLFISGSGSGANWSIAATAGILPAMESALIDAVAARDTAVLSASAASADRQAVAADKATVLTYRNQAQTAATSAAAHAASVAQDSQTIAQLVTVLDDGPVLTVNGRVGAVTLDKTDVGLGHVDNTSDANKPISSATQTALNAKQDTLVSGTNIKTVNGASILGSGNVVAGLKIYAYDDRAQLRSLAANDGDTVAVDGLGVFAFKAGSDEPDDDETCFSTSTGRWLIEAVHPELSDAINLPTNDFLEEQRILYGSIYQTSLSVYMAGQTYFLCTILGAEIGDSVIVNPPAQMGAPLTMHARVTSANTVTIYINNANDTNTGGQTGSVSAGYWRVVVIKEF